MHVYNFLTTTHILIALLSKEFGEANSWRLEIYRVIKMSLCTRRLQYKRHAKIRYFKQFQLPTMITQFELGITDGVSVSLLPHGPGGRLPSSEARKTRVVIIGELKMTVTEYFRNVDSVILNTVFENTVQRVHKCLETGGELFEYYL